MFPLPYLALDVSRPSLLPFKISQYLRHGDTEQRRYNLINEPHTKCWRSSGGDTIPLGLTIECDLEIEGKKVPCTHGTWRAHVE